MSPKPEGVDAPMRQARITAGDLTPFPLEFFQEIRVQVSQKRMAWENGNMIMYFFLAVQMFIYSRTHCRKENEAGGHKDG